MSVEPTQTGSQQRAAEDAAAEMLATPPTLPRAKAPPLESDVREADAHSAPSPPRRLVGKDVHPSPHERFERLELIGRGGYGEVWRVRYLGSEEVWKYVPLQTAEEEHTLREAVHSRRVDHPNVVRVYDVFREGEAWVLRMELVKGRDLFRIVREEGILDVRQVVRIALQVAETLQAAHEQGIVHLDLKPHNLILRDEDERVMLTDFGISASIVRDFAVEELGRGTPYFMAPEQIHGRGGMEPQADIWSFGVSLYFLLCGEYPFAFEGVDYREAILHGEPIPLCERLAVLEPELWHILAHCLEKDSADRYASMRVLAADLRTWWETAFCPACNRGVRLDQLAGGRCPLADCASVRAGGLDKRFKLHREGQARFAHSDFKAAARCFEGVILRDGGSLDLLSERAQQAARVSWEARAELRAQLERVRAAIAADEHLQAFEILRSIPPRFSRSPERRKLEGVTLGAIGARIEGARHRVERLMHSADFGGARALLEEVRAFLASPSLRARLVEREGRPELLPLLEEGGEDALEQLARTIDEREEIFQQHGAAFDAAVDRLDFDTAKEELGTLYHWFHLREHLEKIRDLNQAAEIVVSLAPYGTELLMGLLKNELDIDPEQALEFHTALQRCREILEAFSPERYPGMKRFDELETLLERSIVELHRRGSEALAAAREAEREGRLEEAFHLLEAKMGLLTRTDLFSREAQDEARRIFADARMRTEKAMERYEEGRAALEERLYAQALTAFEEVQRLDPLRFENLDELFARAREFSERARILADDLQPLYYALVSWTPVLDDLLSFLRRSQELCELQDETRRGETRRRMREVFARAIALRRDDLIACPDVDRLCSILHELDPLAHDSRSASYCEHVRDSAEVALEIEESIRLVLARYRAEIPILERRVLALEGLVDALGAWRHLLLSLPFEKGARHPAVQLARALVDTVVERRGSRAERLRHAGAARALLVPIGELVPVSLGEELNSALTRIRRIERGQLLRGRLRLAVRLALWVGIPLAIMAALAWGTRRLALREVAREARGERLAFLERHGLDPSGEETATALGAGMERWAAIVHVLDEELPRLRRRLDRTVREGDLAERLRDLSAIVQASAGWSPWILSHAGGAELRAQVLGAARASWKEQLDRIAATAAPELGAPGVDYLGELRSLGRELRTFRLAMEALGAQTPPAAALAREVAARHASWEELIERIVRGLESFRRRLGGFARLGAGARPASGSPAPAGRGEEGAKKLVAELERQALALRDMPPRDELAGRLGTLLERALLRSVLDGLGAELGQPIEACDPAILGLTVHHELILLNHLCAHLSRAGVDLSALLELLSR